ncbi:MAG TPA: hypothetical protein VH482_05745 [Thermomicrobiales bacterium]|jgi:hypothetical protein
MAAKSRAVHISDETNLLRLLDDAVEAPVLLERDGMIFRLSRDMQIERGPTPRRRVSAVAHRESTPLLQSLAELREAIAQGGCPAEDSTELIRESRRERTAQLLRAVGWEPEEPRAGE